MDPSYDDFEDNFDRDSRFDPVDEYERYDFDDDEYNEYGDNAGLLPPRYAARGYYDDDMETPQVYCSSSLDWATTHKSGGPSCETFPLLVPKTYLDHYCFTRPINFSYNERQLFRMVRVDGVLVIKINSFH